MLVFVIMNATLLGRSVKNTTKKLYYYTNLVD
jgi:hypothetical protein